MKSDIINSVDRALEILLTIYENNREMGISELSEQLGIYKSTVFRTLKTMEERGFVRQNPTTKNYWFGTRIYAIGLSIREKMHLQDVIAPYTRRLYEQCHEIVNVSILENSIGDFHQSIIIHKEFGDKNLLFVNQPLGSSTPCYCSSVGKCLLAYTKGLDFSIYKTKPMERFNERTINSYESLMESLEDVKRKGYALDDEEREIGLTCIGAPIIGRDGSAVAAISVSGPASRMNDGHIDEKIEMVVKTAWEISKEFR